MGFDQQSRRKVYELPFRPYPGLTVWCRKPGFRALEKLTEAVVALGDNMAGDQLASPDKIRWWGVLFRAFARSLVGWNLTDRGHGVPATKRGVLDQDHEFLLSVCRAWYYAVVMRVEQPDAPSPAPVDAPLPDPDDEIDELEMRLADIPVQVHDAPREDESMGIEPDPVPA